MHWLSSQVEELQRKADAHARARKTKAELEARDAFLSSTKALVAEIGTRDGVTACFVAHDGLLADCRGHAEDFEALAAVAQTCATTASTAGLDVSLGRVSQVVLVGEHQKLALLLVGQLALGILCPVDTRLHEILA